MKGKIPDELFRTPCSHNSAPHSDNVKQRSTFILILGRVIKA